MARDGDGHGSRVGAGAGVGQGLIGVVVVFGALGRVLVLSPGYIRPVRS